MERKIGEIFEYNGEWLQCVEQPKKYDKTVCAICAFQGNGNCELDRCSGTYRSDKKFVIFKKLEKVGEPYSDYCPSGRIICFQRYKCYQKPIYTGNFICWADDINISIEIKQTKEDMKEKNGIMIPKEDNPLTRIVYNYVSGKISDKELIKSIKEMSDEYLYNKNSLKPFDLEAAKAGKPVCTRDGRNARILCYDFKQNEEYPILVAVENKDGKECALLYSNGGISEMYKSSNNELAMLPEKKEGWINIYNADTTFYYADGRVFETKDEAVQEAKEEVEKEQREKNEYIDTIRVEWEE